MTEIKTEAGKVLFRLITETTAGLRLVLMIGDDGLKVIEDNIALIEKQAKAEAQAALIPKDAERPPIEAMENYLDSAVGDEPDWDIQMKADELRKWIAYIRRLEALLARLDALDAKWANSAVELRRRYYAGGNEPLKQLSEQLEACLNELRAAREIKA